MAYRQYQGGGYGRPGGMGSGLMNIFGPITPTVKILVIINVALFVLNAFAQRLIFEWFGLIPAAVVPGMQLWRLVTYMFLHANISHILFNMLTLWWFGSPLEQIWGRNKFLVYYFLTGIGAGVVCVPFYILIGQPYAVVVGASGMLFGLFVAMALIYPNARVYLMLIMPIKMKWLVLFLVGINLMMTASQMGGGGSSIASIAHLSGGLIGYLYLRRLMDLKAWWLRFKLRKMQRPYRVIHSDDDEPRGPWLN